MSTTVTTINGLIAATNSNASDISEVEQSLGGGSYQTRKVTETQRIANFGPLIQLSGIGQVTGLSAALAACLQVTNNLSDLNNVITSSSSWNL